MDQFLQTFPSLDDFIDRFGTVIPLLHKLKETPQDHIWHAEGDVATHTDMVLSEVEKLLQDEASHLSESKKLSLILSAGFHDIMKPLTTKTKEKYGRICLVSPKHEIRGRNYLAYRLVESDVPYSVVVEVLNLVGYHSAPKHFIKDDEPKSEFWKLSRKVNVELLYFLEIADMRGRTCADKKEQVLYIELFKEQCIEYGVWKTDPYAEWDVFIQETFKDYMPHIPPLVCGNARRDFEAGKIYTPEEAISKAHNYVENAPNLILLMGPSGSGKSTWTEEQGIPIVSLDTLREEINGNRSDQSNKGEILQEAQERLRVEFRKGGEVIYDATNLRRDFRSKILKLAHDYNAFTQIVVFHKPLSQLYRDNAARPYSVPESVLERQIESVEWVDVTEAHSVVYIR